MSSGQDSELETQVIGADDPDESSPDTAGSSSSLAQNLAGFIDRLGRYTLLERLGKGAFGTVWAAFDPQLDRKVAIKLIYARRTARRTDRQTGRGSRTRSAGGSGLSLGGDDLIGEAQILAQLSHPNVVAIHDVGRIEDAQVVGSEFGIETPTGVFIVMEYLDGPTLAAWMRGKGKAAPVLTGPSQGVGRSQGDAGKAAENSEAGGAEPTEPDPSARPSIGEILRVFIEAGRGLQAAHARDLIHLDFKPGNVMFGADGRVRVLDFGLARAKGRGSADGELTQSKVGGTPAYMAPEQHAGMSTDARADQYAFCASLWEAIFEQRPFAGNDVKAIAMAKLGDPPTPPRSSAAPAHIVAALQRGMDVEPARRFPNMGALLEVLGDDPALRRRRWALGVALVTALLGAGFGLARAAEQQTRADPCVQPESLMAQVWDQPRREQTREAFVATELPFAADTFDRAADALDAHLHRWSRVRDQVCRATLVSGEQSVEAMSEQMLCLDRQLRQVAGLTATLSVADAEIVARALESVQRLEDPDDCRRQAARDDGAGTSDAANEARVGEERRAALLTVEDALAKAEAAKIFGRYEQGLAAAEEALAAAEAVDDRVGAVRARASRGALLRLLGRLDDAREVSWAALEEAAVLGEDELEARIMIELVSLHTSLGEYESAQLIARIARGHIDAEQQPRLAARLHLHLGMIYQRRQQWDESLAEIDAGEALLGTSAASSEGEGARASMVTADYHLARANVLIESGRDIERAVTEYEQTLAMLIAAYGEHHPQVGTVRLNLGAVYFRRGELERTAENLEAALALFRELYPPEHPNIGLCLQNLGAIRMLQGDYALAVAYTKDSLEIMATRLGKQHPDYASAERNLGTLAMLEGRYAEALVSFEHAAQVYAGTLTPEDSRVVAVAAEQAEANWWLGNDRAFAQHIAAVEAAVSEVEPGDRRRLGPLSALALAYRVAGKLEQARVLADEMLAFMIAVVGVDQPDTARARVQLAEIARLQGDEALAREQLDLALASLQRKAGREHPYAWLAYYERGKLEAALGNRDAALGEFDKALANLGPEGSPVHVALIERSMAEALRERDPTRAQALAVGARAVLDAAGVRADL